MQYLGLLKFEPLACISAYFVSFFVWSAVLSALKYGLGIFGV